MSAKAAPPTWVSSACQGLAFGLPWLLGVWHANPNPHFASDFALVRSFGLLPVGFEGLISAALSALLAWVPLGGLTLRSAFVSALGLGLGGLFTFRLARGFVRRSGARAAFEGPLALLAALGATIGPSWVLEGSVAGGHALAAALALAALDVAEPHQWSPRRALGLGALAAATLLESRWTGVGVVLALALRRVLSQAPLLSAEGAALGIGFAAPLLLPVGAFFAFVASTSARAGMALSATAPSLFPAAASVERSVALSAWLTEVGVIGLALSLLGVGVALSVASERRVFAPLLVFLGLDLALRAANAEPTRHDPMWGVRLVALAALGVAGVLALSKVLAWSSRARIVFARPAGILLFVYGVTLVLVSAEDALRAAETRELNAVGQYTEAALASLPPHSVLLVRSEPLLFRLLAAQATRGSRPDVLVVPFQLLERGGTRAAELSREPGLLPLVREMLLKGEPSEFALSALADARPTFVDLGPFADERLAGHLVPQPFFTAFASQPLARSDRERELDRGASSFARVVAALKNSPDGDPATRSVLAAALAERALLLASFGDREASAALVAELRALDPRSPIALSLGQKLNQRGKGRINVRALLAAR